MAIPTTAEYLARILNDSLENNRNIRYDADIAKALGVSKATMSLYRHGHNMSVLVALKVSEILRIHPMETIAATMVYQSKSEEDIKLWTYYYEKYQSN